MISLGVRESRRFAEALRNPPEPSEYMLEAEDRYRRLVGRAEKAVAMASVYPLGGLMHPANVGAAAVPPDATWLCWRMPGSPD